MNDLLLLRRIVFNMHTDYLKVIYKFAQLSITVSNIPYVLKTFHLHQEPKNILSIALNH